MDTTLHNLLLAFHDDPAGDRRLVLADRLEELGDDRAAAVRKAKVPLAKASCAWYSTLPSELRPIPFASGPDAVVLHFPCVLEHVSIRSEAASSRADQVSLCIPCHFGKSQRPPSETTFMTWAVPWPGDINEYIRAHFDLADGFVVRLQGDGPVRVNWSLYPGMPGDSHFDRHGFNFSALLCSPAVAWRRWLAGLFPELSATEIALPAPASSPAQIRRRR